MEILSAHIRKGNRFISVFPSDEDQNYYKVTLNTVYLNSWEPRIRPDSHLAPKSALCASLRRLHEAGWTGLRLRVMGADAPPEL